MMFDKIKDLICGFVEVDPEEITAESKLTTDLGLCSLDLAMLSSEIEKEFGVSISAKTFATVKTVGGIVDYIENEQK
ncbi:MAG: acyl carrier protein [Clostridia bacterium]|nr:acyl carrier protein [Clostridia bacterium]